MPTTWIERLLGSAGGAPSEVFILEELKATQGAPESRAIGPDEEYVSVVVKSLHIPFRRLQFATFHGTVMSQVTLAHTATGEAAFHVVTSPEMLKSNDAQHLARVIQLNQVLLDRVPFRGGKLNVEIGLFAEKSADLARPLVDVVSKVAGAAGVGFVSAAQPFVEPLRHAIDVLSGVPGAFTLLLGIHGYLEPVTGCLLAIAATRQQIGPGSLKLRPGTYELVKPDGTDFTDAAYMVLAVEGTQSKPDWARIPELRAANQRVIDALTKTLGANRRAAAEEALSLFRLTVLTSPDLIFEDSQKIVEKAQNRMTSILDGTGFAKILAEVEEWPDDLDQL